MQIIRDLASTEQIGNPEIRELVEQRITDLGGEAFDASTLGYFLVIEPWDALAAIDAQMSFSILANRSTGIRFDQPGFAPSFECVEGFPSCYDMVFIISDDGYGIEVFIPKTEGVQRDLLTMCQRYAVQGTT